MDPHSKALSSLKDQGQIAAARVSQEIIEWKATFSLRWYHQFVQDDIKRLSYVFSLLFELTEFPDSNVTIASFNAIGALLVSISPFRSDELIKAFKSTLTGLAVSPNTSCAVIATFVFLSHQVSEHNISDFIDSTPIIHHFGADLRQFIHHIPNLIEQMDRLNLDFHQALLRSLVSSFGRNPVGAFIDSTMLLIRKYPEKLISDLLEFVESNNLDATLLAVGGPILNNKAFAKFLSPQKKVNLGEIVRKKTNMENITATELEQSVAIIRGLKIQEEEQFQNMSEVLRKEILNAPLKEPLKRNLIPLLTDVEQLKPQVGDSSNIISSKIATLNSLGNDKDEEVLKICEQYIDNKDDVFIAVVTFLAHYMKEKAYKLIRKILSKDDYSWVHKMAILELIDNINQFKMHEYFPDYTNQCINFLIKCAISQQVELAKLSREVCGRFVSLNNVEQIREAILKCDFFNIMITRNILLLLNEIISHINPLPMRCFIGIILELIEFNYDANYLSECFEFLSHFPGYVSYNKNVENICVKKMQQVYYSYTQERLFPSNNQFGVSIEKDDTYTKPILSSITTDIVADASLVFFDFLKPLKTCLEYLASIKVQAANNIPILNKLLLLFPKEILPLMTPTSPAYANFLELSSTGKTNSQSQTTIGSLYMNTYNQKDESAKMLNKVNRIFNSNRNQFVVSQCCEYYSASHKISNEILNTVKSILDRIPIQSAAAGFNFFNLIYQSDPKNALLYLKKMMDSMPALVKNELIVLASKIPNVEAVLSKHFSFLQYKTNKFVAKQWFESHAYHTWPLNNLTIKNEILSMFENTHSIKIKNLNALDTEHWEFVIAHRSSFNLNEVLPFLKENQATMKTLLVYSLDQDTMITNAFSIDKSVSKLPTIGVLVNKSRFVNDERLVKNFLLFSSKKADPSYLAEVNEAIPGLTAFFKNYSVRNKISLAGARPRKQIQVKDENKLPNLENQNQSLNSNLSKEDVAINEPKQDDKKEEQEIETKINNDIDKDTLNSSELNTQEQLITETVPQEAANSSESNHQEQHPTESSPKEIAGKANYDCTTSEPDNLQNINQVDHLPDEQTTLKDPSTSSVLQEMALTEQSNLDAQLTSSENNEIPQEPKADLKEQSLSEIHDNLASQDLTQSNNSPNASAEKGKTISLQKRQKKITVSPANAIPKDFNPNFEIKSALIKELCDKASQKPIEVSLYRMSLIERIHEIRKPKKFFYFLRFLRVNFVVQQNSKETLAVKKNTIEHFNSIIQCIQSFYEDYIIYEFIKLITDIYNPNEQIKIAESTFPNFAISSLVPCNIIQSKRKRKIPSFVNFLISKAFQLPTDVVTQFFTRYSSKLLSCDILSDMTINFMTANHRCITSFSVASVYISNILNTHSPLFIKGEFILPIFFQMCHNHLDNFSNMLDKLPVLGYSLPFALNLVISFYSILEKSILENDKNTDKKKSIMSLKIKEVRTAQAIYQTYPTIFAALKLSDIFISSQEYIDALAIIFGKLILIESGFIGVFCIAVKYYRAFNDKEKKRFEDQVKRLYVSCATFKSRLKALELFVQNPKDNIDVAFAVACLETSDESEISNTIQFIQS